MSSAYGLIVFVQYSVFHKLLLTTAVEFCCWLQRQFLELKLLAMSMTH